MLKRALPGRFWMLLLWPPLWSFGGTTFQHIRPKSPRIERGRRAAKVLAAFRGEQKARFRVGKMTNKRSKINSNAYYQASQVGLVSVGIASNVAALLARARRLRKDAHDMEKAKEVFRQKQTEDCFRLWSQGTSHLTAEQLASATELNLENAKDIIQEYAVSREGSLNLREFAKLFPVLSEKCEQIKATQIMNLRKAETTKMRMNWEARQQLLQEEIQAKWLQGLPIFKSSPLRPTVTLLSASAYILPMVDMVRLWSNASNEAPLWFDAVQPFVFVCVALITAENSVPKQISFHLNQAFLLDMMLQVVKLSTLLFACAKEISRAVLTADGKLVASGDTFCICLLVKLVVVAFAFCVGCSMASALHVVAPVDIPKVSAEARERSEAWALPDYCPSPSWFPALGSIAFSVVFVDYWVTLYNSVSDALIEL